jgi:hypothetical protein
MPRLLDVLRRNRAFALALACVAVLAVAWMMVERPVRDERRLAERIASGKAIPHHFYVPVYLWRGLLVNVGLGVLLAGACYLAGRKLQPMVPRWQPSVAPLPTGQKVAIMLALALVAYTGTQRLGHSTWGDEDYTVKTYIQPEVSREPGQPLQFRDRQWHEVIWHGKRTNNHFGYTAVAKVFHDVFFRPGAGPEDPYFSEALVRTPAFLAGLLSVPVLVSGWWAILLIWVAHPWLVRFSTDARGYAFVLLGVPLLLGLAAKALQSGAWRWWLLLAVVQTLCFWSYFAIFYVLIPLHMGLVWALWTATAGDSGRRLILLSRWAAASLLSAMVIVQLMAPLLPQLLDYIRASSSQITGSITSNWWQDAMAYFLLGTPWHEWSVENPLSISVRESSAFGKVMAVTAAVGLLAWFAQGVRSLVSDRQRRWLLVPVLGAPALFFIHMLVSGIKPYHWYLQLFLPAFLLVVGHGLSKRSTPLLAGAVVVAFLLASHPQRLALWQHPIEACRESVELTRTIMNPRHPDYGSDSITLGFTMFTEAYDPGLVRFQTVEELRHQMTEAKATGRQLFVNFSSRAYCETHYPELFSLFNDPELFEVVAVLPGQFDAATREVLRAR